MLFALQFARRLVVRGAVWNVVICNGCSSCIVVKRVILLLLLFVHSELNSGCSASFYRMEWLGVSASCMGNMNIILPQRHYTYELASLELHFAIAVDRAMHIHTHCTKCIFHLNDNMNNAFIYHLYRCLSVHRFFKLLLPFSNSLLLFSLIILPVLSLAGFFFTISIASCLLCSKDWLCLPYTCDALRTVLVQL